MLVHAVELLKARWGARQSSNKQPTTPSRESKLQQLKSFASRTSPLNPFGRRSHHYRRAAKQESIPPSPPSPVPDRSRLSFTDFDVATSGDYWPDLKWSEHPITGGLPRSHTTNDITQLASRVAEADWRESPPPGRQPLRHHRRGGSLTSFPYANEFASEGQCHLPPAPSPPPIPPASTATPPDEIRPPWLLNHSPPAPRRLAKSPMPLRSYTQPNLLSTISETQKANHFTVPHRTVFREEFSASPSPVRRLRHYQLYPPPAPAAPRSAMQTAAVPTHQRRRLSTRRRPTPKLAPPKPTPLAELFPDDDTPDYYDVVNAYTNDGPFDRETPAAASITARQSAPWPTKALRRDSAAALDQDDADADDEDATVSWPSPAHTFAAHWQAPMSSPMPAAPPHDANPRAPQHQHQHQNRQPHHKQKQQQQQQQQHGTTRHSSRPASLSLSPPLQSLSPTLPQAAAAAAAAFHLPSRARLSCESVRPPYASGESGGDGGAYAGESAAYAAAAMPIGVAI
ncbi:uncharacterized protein J3D65DRAFT_607383 [Phyllosticta citribraziliensis]|uniref:Uncharacterized protein n=1 Tax=Phyllosticta citribraziliensis TaxID=989973 RepID=A0ABR1L6L5_9PEZI